MEALKQQERGQIKLLLGGWQGVRPPRTRRSPGPARCGKALRTETSLSPLHSQKGWDPGMARDGPGIKPMAFYRPLPLQDLSAEEGGAVYRGKGANYQGQGQGARERAPPPPGGAADAVGPWDLARAGHGVRDSLQGRNGRQGQGGAQPAPAHGAARPPARLPAGVDAPTSRPGLGSCICWAIASCVSPAQLQFCLLQEALRALQGRAAMSSDESAPQMTRVLSLSRTT